MKNHHKGSCLCGNVKFEVAGKLGSVLFCHCSQCRKQTGLYYATTNAMTEDFTFLSGEGEITWYQASSMAKRGFCRNCGSALFWKPEPEKDYISILAGAFDNPTGLNPTRHIYCESRGDFYEIKDGLPQYPQGSPQ